MKTTLYYFSGTGNTLFITKTIGNTIRSKSDKNEVDIVPIQTLNLNQNIVDHSEQIGIIYPVYFLDSPDIIKSFISKLVIKEKRYLFIYANYGETLGNALYNVDKILEKRGIHVDAHFEVALPDNSIIFDTPRDKIKPMLEEGVKIIEKHAIEISNMVETEKSQISILYKGIGSIIKGFCKKVLGFNKMQVAENLCNGCGICSQLCPMRNITMEKNTTSESSTNVKKPIVGSNCSMCFSCLHYCPKQAITYNKMKKKDEYQYHHPDISVKEMINMNN